MSSKIKQLKFINQPSYFRQTKEEFNTLLTNKNLKMGVQISFSLIGLEFLSLAVFWLKIPPQLPLFYSRPWGKDQLVNKNEFLILPLSSFLFTLINLRLTAIFFGKESFLSYLFVWVSFLINLISVLTLFKILSNTI